ncbi:Uncharacterised protein [BD1-7 clade bacterium]|uniref:Integrase catalytic domain-containing protein n=1 Tax=BD1-7 clade bacterium TaxID=2029982 RepID=A0A5S9QWH6_9GAMM|nr:Uncharacterised protein [BD1-7 clade bacterium]CAA0122913.1 Uncharacterised protein [BD1-7 clade bacterium]
MKEWFTAQELTQYNGLPGTVAGMLKKASNENWRAQKKAHGKGNEYHIDSLPAAAQKAIRISQAKQAATQVKQTPTGNALQEQDTATQRQREQSLARYQQLRPTQKKSVDAKLALIEAVREFHQASGLTKTTAYTEFADLYRSNQIHVEPWIRQAEPTCSKPTLYRWEKKLNEQGIDALAGDKGKGRRGTGTIDNQPELNEYILGMIVDKPHIKMATLNKALQAHFANTQTSLVSIATLERWVNKWKADNLALYTSLINPDQWKNKYMDAQGSASEDVISLNQRWEFDSTPADLMLKDGRHSILGVIDIYSRRTLFIVMPTSDSKGVAKVIRKAILAWGVPETAKTDNGADYKSKWIRHVFNALDVKQEFCPPFQGWKKPHIERVFRTFAHDIAEILPGFIGHNVAERKAIEAQKSFSERLFQKDQLIEVGIESNELQAFCNDWLEYEYHPREHQSLKCSPNEKAATYTGHIRTVSDERLLDVLLSEPAGNRTIKKTGISLNGGTYIHPQLAAHTGQQVNVFYDEDDIGRIYVHDLNGNYLCTAEDPTITGVSRTEVAQKAKTIQKEAIEEERKRLKKAARKVTKRDVAQQILQHRADQERKEKVHHFPRPQTQHQSSGLNAAQQALQTRNPPTQPHGIDTQKAKEEIAQQIKQQNDTAHIIKPTFNRELTIPKGYTERYQYWLAISAAIAEGTATQEEAEWHNRYKNSRHYNNGKMLIEMRQDQAQINAKRS